MLDLVYDILSLSQNRKILSQAKMPERCGEQSRYNVITKINFKPWQSTEANPIKLVYREKLVNDLNKICRGAWLRNISSNMSTPTRQHSVDRRYTIYWCLNLIQRPKEQ